MPAFAPLRPTVGLARTAASAARTFSSSASRSIARMFITGRLAAEPELMTTSTGHEVIKYAVGTNYGPRDNQKTSWFRVGAFVPEGPQRDYILNLPKGYVHVPWDLSLICGRDRRELWTSGMAVE